MGLSTPAPFLVEPLTLAEPVTTTTAEAAMTPKGGNRNAVNTSQLQLSTSSVPCQGVLIKAREANVNDVWVGPTGLTADTTEATGGYRLQPGASVGYPCSDVNQVYLRWATYTAGDGVEWAAGQVA